MYFTSDLVFILMVIIIIMTNSAHILQPYLPERPELTYNLRECSHNRSLITKTMDLTDRDFLIRMLYKCSY